MPRRRMIGTSQKYAFLFLDSCFECASIADAKIFMMRVLYTGQRLLGEFVK